MGDAWRVVRVGDGAAEGEPGSSSDPGGDAHSRNDAFLRYDIISYYHVILPYWYSNQPSRLPSSRSRLRLLVRASRLSRPLLLSPEARTGASTRGSARALPPEHGRPPNVPTPSCVRPLMSSLSRRLDVRRGLERLRAAAEALPERLARNHAHDGPLQRPNRGGPNRPPRLPSRRRAARGKHLPGRPRARGER